MPGRKPRFQLPYNEWPLPDRLLWQRAFSEDDPFADATAAHLSKATRERCLCSWRRFLGFLTKHEPSALDLTSSDRLTIERVRAFVIELTETNAPISVVSIVDALYSAARYMMPESDWGWLKSVKSRLYAAAPAKSPTGPVITSVQLLEFGQTLMDEANIAADIRLNIHQAVQYRDGLMLAFVAFSPLRLRNLTGLEIGRTIVQDGERWFIIIPGQETKTGTPIDFQLPDILVPYLTVYLEIIRSRILGRRNCSALWVSPKSGALSYVGVGKSFQRSSKRFGIPFATHDARDAAATTWAISRPSQVLVSRDLLGHRDLRTTNKHYNRARGIEASRAYRQVISGLLRKGRNLRNP
jgi:integrase/recombinase XerD